MSAAARNPDPTTAAPTSNIVAEGAVIAGLVNCGDPAAIGRYALEHRLDAGHFTQTAYRAAYAAITGLVADGQPVDIPILAQHLDAEDLATVDSACREHVSAANFGHYALILTVCKQRRKEAAARDRLAHAAAAGVPDHELLAIVESIRQASAGDSRECRLTDISSLCDLPPAESWLVKRYLPADSLSVMFGSPGCGKSFLAIDLACHVATGRDWRGHPVKPGRVVYIAGEGKNGLSKRFRAWFDHHGERPRNISLLLTPIALTDPASVAALVADIRALPEAPALVVIDTLNRNFGPGDENSTADMTKAVAGLDAIRTATGAAILGVHHSGHLEKGRGRGSSVLLGAVDAEYAVALLGVVSPNPIKFRQLKSSSA
ncbi:MAG TPA: AAA family ATPase, partial [Candidatus Competibacter denitrificans]|nr:AAA family ATPase [Candidatus Competibacter denitrificans]